MSSKKVKKIKACEVKTKNINAENGYIKNLNVDNMTLNTQIQSYNIRQCLRGAGPKNILASPFARLTNFPPTIISGLDINTVANGYYLFADVVLQNPSGSTPNINELTLLRPLNTGITIINSTNQPSMVTQYHYYYLIRAKGSNDIDLLIGRTRTFTPYEYNNELDYTVENNGKSSMTLEANSEVTFWDQPSPLTTFQYKFIQNQLISGNITPQPTPNITTSMSNNLNFFESFDPIRGSQDRIVYIPTLSFSGNINGNIINPPDPLLYQPKDISIDAFRVDGCIQIYGPCPDDGGSCAIL